MIAAAMRKFPATDSHFIKSPKLQNKVPLPFTKGGGRCAILVPEFPVVKGVLFP
jgi:hypothetical protein